MSDARNESERQRMAMLGKESLASQAQRRAMSGSGVERRERKETKGLHPALKASPIVAAIADAVTTNMAFALDGKQNKHGHTMKTSETNKALSPFAGDSTAMIAAKVASGTLLALGAHALAKSGHRNWAKGATVVATVVPLAAAGINLNNIEKAKNSKGPNQ